MTQDTPHTPDAVCLLPKEDTAPTVERMTDAEFAAMFAIRVSKPEPDKTDIPTPPKLRGRGRARSRKWG